MQRSRLHEIDSAKLRQLQLFLLKGTLNYADIRIVYEKKGAVLI